MENPGEYGPKRYYSIRYEDGDELDDVEDQWVFPAFDYLHTDTDANTQKWLGVRNMTDDESDDPWGELMLIMCASRIFDETHHVDADDVRLAQLAMLVGTLQRSMEMRGLFLFCVVSGC